MGWDNDLKRLGKDPLGATTSIATDPYDRFNANGKTTMTLGGAALEGAKDKPIDALTLGDIQAFMASGRARGEEMTGTSSKNVGKKRGEIRGRYEDIVNGPSRGARTVAVERDAAMKQLKGSQAQQGVRGGLANAQSAQTNLDYAGKIGDVRQKEYLDALNKLETQYRGAASDIMTTEGQYGAIGVGSKPNPTMPGGGNGLMGDLCCFIFLEARYGDGTMDNVVRKFRDSNMTDRNRRGYYKLSEVLVPLMRKSKIAKLLVRLLMTDPMVSYGKFFYGCNKHGWIFKPITNFWLKTFDYLGQDHKYIRENGEIV